MNGGAVRTTSSNLVVHGELSDVAGDHGNFALGKIIGLLSEEDATSEQKIPASRRPGKSSKFDDQ